MRHGWSRTHGSVLSGLTSTGNMQCWSLPQGSPSQTLAFRFEMTQKTLGLTTSSWRGEGLLHQTITHTASDISYLHLCMPAFTTRLSQFRAHFLPAHTPIHIHIRSLPHPFTNPNAHIDPTYSPIHIPTITPSTHHPNPPGTPTTTWDTLQLLASMKWADMSPS